MLPPRRRRSACKRTEKKARGEAREAGVVCGVGVLGVGVNCLGKKKKNRVSTKRKYCS